LSEFGGRKEEAPYIPFLLICFSNTIVLILENKKVNEKLKGTYLSICST
jgi:hypothetical protein